MKIQIIREQGHWLLTKTKTEHLDKNEILKRFKIDVEKQLKISVSEDTIFEVEILNN